LPLTPSYAVGSAPINDKYSLTAFSSALLPPLSSFFTASTSVNSSSRFPAKNFSASDASSPTIAAPAVIQSSSC
jgi:hypothetical protein